MTSWNGDPGPSQRPPWLVVPETAKAAIEAPSMEASEFKACCARFYADDVVRHILGESFHPGGLDLTRRILSQVKLSSKDRLLDVAAGQGTSAILAAREFGCRVCALDLSGENLDRAAKVAKRSGLEHLLETRTADAERLPYADETFDVVLCECAFCTFRDRHHASGEMLRVLKPGGRLAFSDMTVSPEGLPDELDSLILKVACIADAITEDDLITEFRQTGFSDILVEDASQGLMDMTEEIRRRLLGVKLASRLGKISLGGIDLDAGMKLADRSLSAILDGSIRYVTMTARKREEAR